MDTNGTTTTGGNTPAASPPPARKVGRPRHTKMEGKSLLPNAINAPDKGAPRTVKYWIGLIPECPRGSVDIAGVHFPKITARVRPSAGAAGLTDRVPEIGVIADITEEQYKKLCERIPRTVVRYLDGDPEVRRDANRLGDEPVSRKGHVITIPSDEEVEERRKSGYSARTYRPAAGDVGIAKFLFMARCEDQENGERGTTYPYTLDQTGLSWPYPIKD